MKTNKSFTSRIRVTKKGKILARRPGLNHFRAKKSRVDKLAKRKAHQITFGKKTLQRYINYGK